MKLYLFYYLRLDEVVNKIQKEFENITEPYETDKVIKQYLIDVKLQILKEYFDDDFDNLNYYFLSEYFDDCFEHFICYRD